MIYRILFFIFFLFGSYSCKKFIELPAPNTSINAANIFHSNSTAIGTLNAVYVNGGSFSLRDIFLWSGLLSDELILYNSGSNYAPYYQNALSPTSPILPWVYTYTQLYYVNAAIEGITASSSLTPAVKQQLLGEARFMRAFYYFNLYNLFGDVPLALSTDPEANRQLSRAPKSEIYGQIVSDLISAKGLLNKKFPSANLLDTTTERVRPTYWAATALLARVYLYNGEYQNAADEASNVINNSSQFNLTALSDVFLKNSSETIWALQPPPLGAPPYNTPEGYQLILPSSGPANNEESGFYLSDSVVNSFEIGDDRKTNWVSFVAAGGKTYPFAYKYKAPGTQTSITEYQVVLRLAEQYLIRAEAIANGASGGLNSSTADLNVIRHRAGLSDYAGQLTKEALISALLHERQVEFFTEWGHRWFDLKRTPGFINTSITRADEVMPTVTTAKQGTWNGNWKLLPIPLDQLLKDPNMINGQNPGYN